MTATGYSGLALRLTTSLTADISGETMLPNAIAAEESAILDELVNFDLSGWHEHERSRVSISWHNQADERLSLSLQPIRWGTWMIFEREYWLDFARKMSAPGGIVSVDPYNIQSRPAMQIIYKRTQGMGYAYTGMLFIHFQGQYCVVMVACREGSFTGIREAVLQPQLMDEGKIRIRIYPFYKRLYERLFKRGATGYVEGWFRDPYDPSYRGVILCCVSDNEEFDSQFPDHPLSRVRSILKSVRDTLRFADAPPSIG